MHGRHVTDVLVDPGAPASVYAVANGTPFKSADAGRTWLPIDAGLAAAWVVTLTSDGVTLWAGALERFQAGGAGGVYVSRDEGASWQRVDAIRRGVTALAADPRHPGVAYAGQVAITLSDDCYFNAEILKTVDGGAHWTTLLTFDDPDEQVVAFALDPTAPGIVYAATYVAGVLRSVDAGLTWEERSAGIDPGCCAPAVASLAIDPALPRLLWAGNHRGVFTSTDRGASWRLTALATPQPYVQVAGLAVDPVRNVLYASVSGDFFGTSDATGKGVFRSADGGASWEEAGRGLPASGASALALDPAGARLYAATAGASVYALAGH